MNALLFVAMVCSLALAAFCAGVETGFFSVNRGRVLHLAREGGKAAGVLQAAIQAMPRTLTTLLVGNNLAAVVFSSASAALAARMFPAPGAARAAWTLLAAFAILYLGEFLPKLFFSSRPLARLVKAASAYRALAAALKPAAMAAEAVTGLFSVGSDAGRYAVTIGDLERILGDRRDGVRLTDFELALVSRILVLRRKGRPVDADALLEAVADG